VADNPRPPHPDPNEIQEDFSRMIKEKYGI